MRLGTCLAAFALLVGPSAGIAVARGPTTFLWAGAETPGTIVIHTGERRLYLVTGEGEAVSYRIAVGREGKQWFGRTSVVGKVANPGWRPTAGILADRPYLPAYVPPGPRNPLGVRAIYLSQGALRIHGTNAPSSIGKAASYGCYRMHNSDVVQLFERVRTGAEVIVKR